MLTVIILAAGQSKRMQSKTPKILHKIGGQPVINYVIDAAKALNPQQIIVVTSESLKNHEVFAEVETVMQETPNGTGGAVIAALPFITGDKTIIICGDTPLITAQTLGRLKDTKDDLTVVGMKIDDVSSAYGRLVCDHNGFLQRIVEYKDATKDEKLIAVANSGVYKFKTETLKRTLSLIDCKNAAGEYYLTDTVKIARDKGFRTGSMLAAEPLEFIGINTRAELSQAEALMQKRWRTAFLDGGVTLHQPETIFFSFDTKIGKDCVIGPFVTFGPGVTLDEDVTILPYCHIEHTMAHPGVTVGPFAHCRGRNVLQDGAQIGNFVEVKCSEIGPKAKAKHLSYIGDATIGAKSNIGAGTITCNYDGFKKFKTRIGAGVMVGGNSTIVAPVKIGDEAMVAAGSTITDNIDAEDLGIARARQVNKHMGATKFRDKAKK